MPTNLLNYYPKMTPLERAILKCSLLDVSCYYPGYWECISRDWKKAKELTTDKILFMSKAHALRMLRKRYQVGILESSWRSRRREYAAHYQEVMAVKGLLHVRRILGARLSRGQKIHATYFRKYFGIEPFDKRKARS